MDETVDPLAGGGERDAVSGLAGGDPQGDGQVCLAGAGRAEEDHVLLAGDEIQGAQMGHRLPFQPAQVSEVELLQGLAGGETGHADATLSAMRLSGGDLALQAGGQTPDVSRTRWWRVQRAGRQRPAGPTPVAAPSFGALQRRSVPCGGCVGGLRSGRRDSASNAKALDVPGSFTHPWQLFARTRSRSDACPWRSSAPRWVPGTKTVGEPGSRIDEFPDSLWSVRRTPTRREAGPCGNWSTA